ncbi:MULTISPECIES: hypothetical protein [Pseudomonas]|uniref:Uncharacterized protein n=1 Tax=Pseudomonas fluorescens TaxID=294 RepID=A0A161XFH9_PSEFL|nr:MULTISPECIES: hypothetical protein [Pseudomonas]KZN20548.1 hypothetical protein A1D17_03125 [Pseudomonas fluorescens]
MNLNSVVSVKKVEQGYCFSLEDGSRAWSDRLSNEAAIALAEIPAYGVETSHESILVELLELRRMGLIELTDEGEMVLPLTVSKIGRQVDEMLADLQLQPVGTVKTFGPAPVERAICKTLPASHRNIGLVGGSFLMVLAITMFALGYHALTSLTSFITVVIKGGGVPSEAAFGLMVEPTGLLMQFLLVVVVPTVVLLLVGARQVRTAIALPK